MLNFTLLLACILVFTSFSQAFPLKFSQLDPRIVNGNEVKPHSLPHQAALFVTIGIQEAFCGGSLISPDYVLTAAHCLDGAHSVKIILGAHDLRDLSKTTQIFTAKTMIVHENWNPFQVVNDIGLIRLNQSAKINEYVKPVKLPNSWDAYNTYEWANATVSGWGKTTDSSMTISPVLFATNDTILPNPICTTFYTFNIRQTQICLSGFQKRSACNGDSGGPLIINDGNLKQIGIVSFGSILGCASGWPSVYTRTTSYTGWIQKNANISLV